MASQTDVGLQVSAEEGAAWSRKLVMTVAAERVRAARKKATRKISKRVKIAGFRKGKVPVHILEQRFGGEIDRQTQQTLIDDAFAEAVRQHELEPISEPQISNLNYDPEAEFTFEVKFDVRPQIELDRVGGFRVTRARVSVNETEVDDQLELVRRQRGAWKPIERHAQPGDTVDVEITDLESDDPEPRQYKFMLGEGQAIPGVEAAIFGLDPGGEDDFSIDFPDDFPDQEKRGQSQKLHIKLKRVLERELPELDDEFARSLGEFDDLDALRRAISEDLVKDKEREVEAQVERQIIEQIIESNPFEVPETMVHRYIAALIGHPPEGADPEAVRQAVEGARPAAIWGIKRTLILQRVAADQSLEATEEEVKQRIAKIAERAGRPVQEVRARLAKTGDLRDLQRQILDEMVFVYLREQSEIADEAA